ncbi:MAG: hypothetical protein HYV14_17460 [Elusimicrobia bacterium]|nr:hypothetical protein [Elusimicrobiota bacterium]
MRRAPGLTAAVFLALAPPAAAAKVALVVAGGKQAAAAAAHAAKDVSVLDFDRVELADPIDKGRFLAALQASDRVVAAVAGDGACGWINREVDGVSVHCVTPYDAGQVIAFARSAGWRRVAVVHMAGYEKVFGSLRARARQSGVELAAVRVERLRDLPAALPAALPTAQAVWILGAPALTEGAAFEYLVKRTLAKRIPLIAPGAGSVARGAFLGAESDPAALVRHAVGVANAAAAGAAPDASPAEVPGGRLVFNKVLARRWGVAVPEAPR